MKLTPENKRNFARIAASTMMLVGLSLGGLGGCGSGNNSPAPVTPAATNNSTGFTTQYGCLVQNTCPSGQAWFQQLNNNAGGCVPVTGGACTVGTNTNSCNANCASGQYSTQYGCLAQNNCTYGQAWYQAMNNNAGGCVPITTPTGCTTNGTQNCSGQPGTYATQYGCLTQGGCAFGQAFYPQANNNAGGCVAVINGGNGSGGVYGGGGYGGYPGNGYGYNNGGLYGYGGYGYGGGGYGYGTYGYPYTTPYYGYSYPYPYYYYSRNTF